MVFVTQRMFETSEGTLTLTISRQEDSDPPAYAYEITTQSGSEPHSQIIYGADDMQALLLCLAAAGDYVKRFHPDASFLGIPGAGLLETSLDVSGEWRAEATMPLPQENSTNHPG